jgi:hypothetical protein
MGVPISEVGYTPAMSRREEHEVHKRTCGGIGGKKNCKHEERAKSEQKMIQYKAICHQKEA